VSSLYRPKADIQPSRKRTNLRSTFGKMIEREIERIEVAPPSAKKPVRTAIGHQRNALL